MQPNLSVVYLKYTQKTESIKKIKNKKNIQIEHNALNRQAHSSSTMFAHYAWDVQEHSAMSTIANNLDIFRSSAVNSTALFTFRVFDEYKNAHQVRILSYPQVNSKQRQRFMIWKMCLRCLYQE